MTICCSRLCLQLITGINMEEVAIMMPAVVNNDELSDEAESINLDLHVSDTEESTESLKSMQYILF